MSNGKKILLRGIGASPGRARGEVKIILTPEEVSKMREGNILVLPFSNPLYTSAIMKCSALITDKGGMTSHGAIIARELGIPAVVGTEKASSSLKDGQVVIVDGERGEVYEE